MRIVFAFLAAAVAFAATPAWSQTNGATAESAQTYAPSHLTAARDALQAILVDTGSLSVGSLQAFTLLAPQFRDQIVASPIYASLSPERQAALVAYIENFPPIGQEETLRGAPQVIERFAPRMAALFNEADLIAIATYIRTPDGASYFRRSVTDGVQSEATGQPVTTTPTESELAALNAFNATPAGIAFNARADQLGVLMREVGQASTGASHIGARLRHDMCAIVGEQCPPGWRN